MKMFICLSENYNYLYCYQVRVRRIVCMATKLYPIQCISVWTRSTHLLHVYWVMNMEQPRLSHQHVQSVGRSNKYNYFTR